MTETCQSLAYRLTILDILPYDIVNAIFSLLDQPTCLECMTVCRAWYNSIPNYAIDLWKTVEFKRYKFTLSDLRLARCLGAHVKKCVIAYYDDKEVWAALDLLARTRCYHLHSIDFFSCSIQDQDQLIVHLQPLLGKVTELSFNFHDQSLPLFQLISACPQLTHFSFMPMNLVEGRIHFSMTDHPTLLASCSPNTYTSITYLCLTAIIPGFQLTALLDLCPNLRCLVLIKNLIQDMDTLLSHCPRLEFLQCYWESLHPADKQWAVHAAQDPVIDSIAPADTAGGLRELVMDQKSMPLLIQSQQTLEALRITNSYVSPYASRHDWDGLVDIVAPKLKVVSCQHMDCAPEALCRFLQQAPNLQEVTLGGMATSMHGGVLRAIAGLHHLRKLDLAVRTQNISAFGLVQLFYHLKQLRDLELTGGREIVTDDVLLALTHLPLTRLIITNAAITPLGLLAFVERLPQGIRELELSGIDSVPEQVLDRLGDNNLAIFRVCRVANLSSVGLQRFLEKTGVSLKCLHVRKCILSDDPRNRWAAAVKEMYGSRVIVL